ncbi:M4 family metallopeptidase [Legionella israelensis]|uniref:Neutral metalloproteinase n=1 Tax=Legionella israelensis TaxID=454 RepID=A0A0W0V1Q4_9GAMM|nr:M4 family metallopeptidase [Legionella israelensis]KTD14024.1 virulence metalloprotease [Legionella israelensis]QBS09680.1 M4 family peptidase [Legionella israelensis]SCY04088.1 pseudolysin [Legionella israelensis DSM 19235]STX60615.1 virulence metalloprotease [Legionella israelensis]
MKKQMVSFFITWASVSTTFAASESIVWGEVSQTLPQFKQASPSVKHGLLKAVPNIQQNDYQLKLQQAHENKGKHARYQIYYKGIPVWGYQLIFHSKAGLKDTVTGTNITGIEKDIKSLDPALSEETIEKKILSSVKEPIKYKTIDKIIFIDRSEKAHLAYHLSFYTHSKTLPIKAPNYIIDANNGEILKQWNAIRYEKIGQGLGGNAFPLPYRMGMFQHGDALPGLPSLGKFDVMLKDGRCIVKTPDIKVINLQNLELGYEAFPISTADEEIYKLHAFSYPCNEESLYLNYADDTSGPVNYSFSPVNDTMYFAAQTLEMYQTLYGVDKPIGDDLPLRAYTHLGGMDNAFAIPTIRYNGQLLAHQQIVIGNGDIFLTAPAQAVIAHELSHNFTEIHSGLFYEGQSGGINESFSDMAAIALQDYLSRSYSWYWDGEDWTIGREAVIGAQPLRYMDDPTKDGMSIAHASDYTDDLNVHFSSGVFNKAFYLLAHKPGWSVQQAFQVMVDANMNYWSPIAYYDFAACGVIQAAIDRDLDKTAVMDAFAEVGVNCPMHKN